MQEYVWYSDFPLHTGFKFRWKFKQKVAILTTVILLIIAIFATYLSLGGYDGPTVADFSSYRNIQNNAQQSTCSNKATNRGPHQKVVSFSFYGRIRSNRKYFEGIAINAQLVRQFYPNWIMRVYHDIKTGRMNKTLEELEENFSETLDLCFAGNVPGYGNLLGSQQNMWRFLTLSDPLVDISIFRDLDSDISLREVHAVREWLETSHPLHVMRDNILHGIPMLAGMWGVRLDLGHRSIWRTALDKMMLFGEKALSIGRDQEALREFVWPLASKAGFALQHDSYFCKNEGFRDKGIMRPFPMCREEMEVNNFVGARIRSVNAKPSKNVCPVECRVRSECAYC